MSGIALQESTTDIAQIVQAVIQLQQGRVNCVGEFTLNAGATTTTVDKDVSPAAVNVSKDCEIFLSPRTQTAAAALATLRVTSVDQGSFTVTHNNTADVNRTFGFVALG